MVQALPLESLADLDSARGHSEWTARAETRQAVLQDDSSCRIRTLSTRHGDFKIFVNVRAA